MRRGRCRDPGFAKARVISQAFDQPLRLEPTRGQARRNMRQLMGDDNLPSLAVEAQVVVRVDDDPVTDGPRVMTGLDELSGRDRSDLPEVTAAVAEQLAQL